MPPSPESFHEKAHVGQVLGLLWALKYGRSYQTKRISDRAHTSQNAVYLANHDARLGLTLLESER
jgi:hypothetical protein